MFGWGHGWGPWHECRLEWGFGRALEWGYEGGLGGDLSGDMRGIGWGLEWGHEGDWVGT